MKREGLGECLNEMETKMLYQAKCRDLTIPEVDSQYLKFHENIQTLCKSRHFSM